MGAKTKISWTDSTWSAVRGCSRTIAASAPQSGCGDPTGGGCYAERDGYRFSGPGLPYEGLVRMTPNGARWTGKVILVDKHLLDPIRWRRPRRIFTTSVSDPFHERLTNEAIALLYGVMAASGHHIHQCLTKRAKRRAEWFEWVRREADAANAGVGMTVSAFCFAMLVQYVETNKRGAFTEADRKLLARVVAKNFSDKPWPAWPLSNVWEGISVENQHAYMERMPHLAELEDVAVRFLSCEPLLDEIQLDPTMCPECGQWQDITVEDIPGTNTTTQPWCIECDVEMGSPGWSGGLGWLIVGCESGPGARECKVEWLRELRDECAREAIPFLLKQATYFAEPDAQVGIVTLGDGSFEKGCGFARTPIVELPYLDGVQHAAFPEGAD